MTTGAASVKAWTAEQEASVRAQAESWGIDTVHVWGNPAMLAALAELTAERARAERAETALREEVALLEKWADASVRGGWSTHQVTPMRDRASVLAKMLVLATPTPEEPRQP